MNKEFERVLEEDFRSEEGEEITEELRTILSQNLSQDSFHVSYACFW